MPKIIISGTLDELLWKFEAVKIVTDARKTLGWRYFQDDEEWRYETQGDERVCNICRGYAGGWIGSQVPVEFQDYRVWEKAHVKPGTHLNFPHLRWANAPDAYGGCRCNLYWYDYLFVLTNRLFMEMEEVTR